LGTENEETAGSSSDALIRSLSWIGDERFSGPGAPSFAWRPSWTAASVAMKAKSDSLSCVSRGTRRVVGWSGGT
jgi:hypothetical protein